MTYNLAKLSATMLANHITVRFPIDAAALERCQAVDDAEREYALAAERLPVRFQQMWLRSGLAQAGHRHFLDHLDFHPAEGWRIHIFFADRNAISIVQSITDGAVGHGDPRGFDAESFVRDQLERLHGANRLIGGHPWWDEEFAFDAVGSFWQMASAVTEPQ
jgi:hypothetical protein